MLQGGNIWMHCLRNIEWDVFHLSRFHKCSGCIYSETWVHHPWKGFTATHSADNYTIHVHLWQLIGMHDSDIYGCTIINATQQKEKLFFFLGKLHKFCNICICNVSFSTLISRATFMSWICILLQLHESKNAYKIMVPTKFISEMCNKINPRINFWISWKTWSI